MNEVSSQPILDGIAIVNGDKKSVAYRPAFAQLTGSATAAILLQQIMFLWDSRERQPFYKFKATCSHNKYRPGDSWCEELAFTKVEFDGAIKKIGTKITRGLSKQAALDYKMPRIEDFKGFEDAYGDALVIAVQHCVIYWTDGNRVTWYTINQPILNELILMVYGAKPEILVYLDKSRNRLYLDKPKKQIYLSSENTQRSPEVFAAKKPPRTQKKKTELAIVEKTERPRDPLFDAIGKHLFEATTPAALNAFGGRIARVMNGDKDKKHSVGLLGFEASRQGMPIAELDRAKLAEDVGAFWRNFQKFHADIDLKDHVKVLEWWSKFRAAQDKQQTATDNGTATYDENRGVWVRMINGKREILDPAKGSWEAVA